MQSNPMELMESNPVKTWIRLNSRRRRRARGVATCVITHWKQMTNVNVFTNIIHPHFVVSPKDVSRFSSIWSILGLASPRWHLLKVSSPQYAAGCY